MDSLALKSPTLNSPTLEDFQAWQDNPVTKWVFQALRSVASMQEAAWHRQSWEQGLSNPAHLQELRTRADAYVAVTETSYDRLLQLNGGGDE